MDPKQLIQILSQIALLLVVASVGLRANWHDVVGTMRQPGLLLKGLLVVNIVVPLIAVLACMAFPLEPAIRIGIVVAAVSPLAPMLTGKMVRAGMDASFTVGLYVALVAASVLFVPGTIALLSYLLPPDASVSLAPIIRLVTLSVLAPLAIGLLVGTWKPQLAERFAKVALGVGYAAMGLLAIPILYNQAGQIAGLVGNGAVVAMAITVIGGLTIGHLMGGPNPTNQNAIALAASTRHPGIAAQIVAANFQDPRVILSVMLFLAVGVIGSAIYQQWVNRRHPSPAMRAGA